MAFQVIVEWVAHGLEAMGIAVVSVGGSAAMINFARRVMAGDAFEAESSVLRERLARATLLGLEFLVAADIIATVAAVPTLARLLMLTGIILLRTFLSATLMLEVEGRWPWSTASARNALPSRLPHTVKNQDGRDRTGSRFDLPRARPLPLLVRRARRDHGRGWAQQACYVRQPTDCGQLSLALATTCTGAAHGRLVHRKPIRHLLPNLIAGAPVAYGAMRAIHFIIGV